MSLPVTSSITDEADDGDATEPAAHPWLTWRRVITLLLAFSFLAGAVGYYVGTDGPPSSSSVDVGFLYDMVTHHNQGVDLAQIELGRGQEEAVQVFAEEIVQFQSYELGLMAGYLVRLGQPSERPERAMRWMGMDTAPEAMLGMASDASIGRLLASRGRVSDALFLALMTEHHRGGVHMAAYAAEHAKDPAVRRLAARIARNQRIEINELEQARLRLRLPIPELPA